MYGRVTLYFPMASPVFRGTTAHGKSDRRGQDTYHTYFTYLRKRDVK